MTSVTVDTQSRRAALLHVAEPAMRSAAAATWAGAILGVLVGGVGGRLAMRLLMLTSNDAVRGIESDDGFEIGRFTLAGTLALLAVGLFAGVIGGLGYLIIRRWLLGGTALRAATCAAGGACVVGSLLVHSDGVDFTALSPTWLAVGLFIAIPALFGALIVPLVERFDRPGGWFRTRPLPRAAAPLVLWAFPLLAVFVALPVIAVAAIMRFTPAHRGLQTPFVALGVRVVLVGAAALGALALASDVAALT